MRAIILAATALAGTASAQGTHWAEVVKNPARLAVAPTSLSSSMVELDFGIGDLDRDGWDDVVIVRGPAGSGLGFHENFLLMNRGGVLMDETATFAASSDVAGDLGFLTPTNDRDVVVADVTGDGWLDVVTTTTLSDGQPKAISHPRVYVNLAEDGSGNWMGIRYEEARIPQLLTTGGLAVAPRFCDIAAGDVNGDGAIDLHFVDYDNTQTGHSEAVTDDLNDRLLINDGSGFFTDLSAVHLTASQLMSAFGNTNAVADMNGDGNNDILKLSSLAVPYDLQVYYNDPGGQGLFQALGTQDVGSNNPYGFGVGDLNADGKLDLAIQDDSSDRFRLNQGNDGLGRVIWGPLKVYEFAGGSDDGFGHKVRIHDFDGDGFGEVFICDFDIEFLGCARRLHIYHNQGGSPGGDVTLREEAESTVPTSGWKGIKGLQVGDLKGTMDVGVHDFDKDGDADLLLANCAGTNYWENVATTTAVVCQKSLGYAGPGPGILSLCGDDLTTAGSLATLELKLAPAGAPVFVATSSTASPVPLFGGVLVPFPVISVLVFTADADGEIHVPVPGGAGTPSTGYVQAAVLNGAAIEITNALEVQLGS